MQKKFLGGIDVESLALGATGKSVLVGTGGTGVINFSYQGVSGAVQLEFPADTTEHLATKEWVLKQTLPGATGSGNSSFSLSFQESDLDDNGELSIPHGLGSSSVSVDVWDSFGHQAEPDDLLIVDANTVKVVLQGFRPLAPGTWVAFVLASGASSPLSGGTGGIGWTGMQGETGLQGPEGPLGQAGLDGETGPAGLQGETGLQGATGVGFTTQVLPAWEPDMEVTSGGGACYLGVNLLCTQSHTTGSLFSVDMDKWESIDKFCEIVQQPGHGLPALSPVYQDSSGMFHAAQASDTTKLATGFVVEASEDYLMAVSAGYYRVVEHGIGIGVQYCSQETPGSLTSTRPTMPGSFVNAVLEVNSTNGFSVVVSNPAYRLPSPADHVVVPVRTTLPTDTSLNNGALFAYDAQGNGSNRLYVLLNGTWNYTDLLP